MDASEICVPGTWRTSNVSAGCTSRLTFALCSPLLSSALLCYSLSSALCSLAFGYSRARAAFLLQPLLLQIQLFPQSFVFPFPAARLLLWEEFNCSLVDDSVYYAGDVLSPYCLLELRACLSLTFSLPSSPDIHFQSYSFRFCIVECPIMKTIKSIYSVSFRNIPYF